MVVSERFSARGAHFELKRNVDFRDKIPSILVHVQKSLVQDFSVHMIAGDARPGPKRSSDIIWLAKNTLGENELLKSRAFSS